MRSIVLLIATLALVVGGFITYRLFQPTLVRLAGGSDHAPSVMDDLHPSLPTVAHIAPGQRPWIRNIDRLGRPASRFRGDEYLPQTGGRVHVVNPVADFYQYPGGRVQRVHVVGKTGDIEVQQPAEGGSAQSAFDKGSAGPPKRGRLQDVTINLYPDSHDSDSDRSSIKMVTDNLSFDNETFEISTAAIVVGGQEITPADQVKVKVTGDYEFEGKGLKLRWNDLEGRLEFLEIAHGDYLTILHQAGASPLFGGAGVDRNQAGGEANTRPVTEPVVGTSASAVASASAHTPAAAPNGSAASSPAAHNPAGTAAASPRPSHHGPQPPYTATFEREVRVSQGERDKSEKQVATADQMTMDFMLSGSKVTTQPTTLPSGSSKVVAEARPATEPVLLARINPAGVNIVDPATQPASNPTTRPSTRPGDEGEPITVRWEGKLTVLPIEGETSTALKTGESILHLYGTQAPVHVSRDGNDVHCARLDYTSPTGNVALFNSAAFPRVVLRQAGAPADQSPALPADAGAAQAPPDAAVITTEALNYSSVDRIAILHGPSHAQVQLKADPTEGAAKSRPAMLDLHWQRLARIYFLNHAQPGVVANRASHGEQGPAGTGQLSVDHAHFEGDVDVEHPQMALKSQQLDASFAAAPDPLDSAGVANGPLAIPTTGPAASKQSSLSHLVATDGVTCRLTDEAGKKQNVDCQVLTMDTATSALGKLYPKILHFDGDARTDAHAYDATQDLRAAHIEATLKPVAPVTTQPIDAAVANANAGAVVATTGPSTRPAELDTVTATDRVRLNSADGAVATGDHLFVQMIDGQAHARLSGKTGRARSPVDAWAKVIDARQNVVIGPVITVDPKQSITTVEGPGAMHVVRQDTPADKPRPIFITWKTGAIMDPPDNVIDVRGPVSVVSTDPDGTINTANSQHARITLADKPAEPVGAATRPGSTRPSRSAEAADGMKMDLMKNKFVSAIDLDKSAVVKSSLIDPSGAILREFELKSELIRYVISGSQPGAKWKMIVPLPGQMLVRDHRPPAAAGAAPNPGESRGATAFQWAKDLTYDESTSTAVFNQDVLIVHQDDDPKDEPARLKADRVTAVFEPRTNPAGKPVTPPNAAPGAAADPAAQLQLKSMTAQGNASMTRAGSLLTAPEMRYDPVTGWMSAIGTQRQPAAYTDATGADSATADQIDWNAQTWHVKFHNIFSHTGRRQ